jgi:SAM-dependent methyltransferase
MSFDPPTDPPRFDPRTNPARFDSRAGDYAKYRPSYPAAAIDAIFAGLGDPASLTVLDVGAGTGISTQLLAARGARVTGLEPNAEMRASGESAGLSMRDAHADDLGVPAASVDLITSFQSFHWFANAATIAEFARALRTGGRVAIVWNERDDEDPFTRAYGEIVDGFSDRMALQGIRNGSELVGNLLREGGFANLGLAAFPNGQRLDHAGLLGRVRSTSYAPREGEAYATMRAALDAAFERYARDGKVEIFYRTDVFSGDKA